MNNLTVILGAGASHDLIPKASWDRSVKEDIYKPPLTKDLFLMHKNLEQYFTDFPGVKSVLADIRAIPMQTDSAISLEKFLKGLRDSPDKFRRIQFRQFAPYLQKLFYLISQRFCYQPDNFNRLLNLTLGNKFDNVLFLTLNYDLLFDIALEAHDHTNFNINDNDIRKYIPSGANWSYIKLHGSIDWSRPIKSEFVKNPGRTLPSLIDNIRQLGDSLEQALDDKVLIGKSYDFTDVNLKFNPEDIALSYPVLGVPIDDESKTICDALHLEHLNKFLNECQDFLVVGFSGIDKDVLDLLDKKQNGFRKVVIVTKTEKGSRDAVMNFMSYGELSQKLQGSLDPFSGGFSRFLDERKFEKAFYNDFISNN